VLGAMVSAGVMGRHRAHIDRPVSLPAGAWDAATQGGRWTTPASTRPGSPGKAAWAR